ncbi:MAG: sulfotransferase [Planctomycetes bacterium]|nr:sulfotransferase [Planctomycetota bacterium]
MSETAPIVRKPARRQMSYQIARAVCSLTERIKGKPTLNLESLEAIARREVGHCEFVDTSFREPLSILLRSLTEAARLNSIGRIAASMRLRQLLVNRLSLERAWGGAAGSLKPALPPLMRPVYVLGLPRTGTTLLLNLLAADERARHLRYWESLTPRMAAGVRRGAESQKVRQKLAIQQVQKTNLLAPGLAGIHKIEPLGPEECLWLLQNTFLSYSFPLMWNVPEYSEWLDGRSEADWQSAYTHYLETLRLIQADQPGQHWVLKCPLHTPRLSTIARLVPDACFIQTYRNVGEVVASLCSLAYETHRISSDQTDPAQLGRSTVQTLAQWANPSPGSGAASPQRLLNIHYKSLVTQPLPTMRRIYDHFQIPWTQSGETAMRNWLDNNPQRKHGQHNYSLGDFGLTASEVIAGCESYHDAEQQLLKLV